MTAVSIIARFLSCCSVLSCVPHPDFLPEGIIQQIQLELLHDASRKCERPLYLAEQPRRASLKHTERTRCTTYSSLGHWSSVVARVRTNNEKTSTT